MEGGSLVAELAQRLAGKVVISAELTDNDISGIGVESLTAHTLSFFGDSEGIHILDKPTLLMIIEKESEEKAPVQIEVFQKKDFNPLAKEIKSDYKIRRINAEKTPATVEDFSSHFRDRFRKLKEILEHGSRGSLGMVSSIENIKQYADGREISVVGIVYDKITTKKGHILLTLEDEGSTAKVLFLKSERTSRKESQQLFEFAQRIVNDEVIAIRGRISSPFVIANSIISPDIPVHQPKKTEEEMAIAFTSDIHVGSKLFMERHFVKFIEWLNGNVEARRDIAEHIKYLVISGDLVDGIGVYPNQDRELSILDIYKQYSVFFDYLENVPDHIEVFLLAGNHDAVQRAEPQPPLTEDLIGDFKKRNVHILSSPSYVTLHGIKILAYHGTSLDSIIQSIPGCSYAKPEAAMLEVLKKRHISPIYGENPIVPNKSDSLVIDEVPDILHMGHIHKNGYAEYHGTQIINSGAWQSRTPIQVKRGQLPTPAVLPVYETNTGHILSLDFTSERMV